MSTENVLISLCDFLSLEPSCRVDCLRRRWWGSLPPSVTLQTIQDRLPSQWITALVLDILLKNVLPHFSNFHQEKIWTKLIGVLPLCLIIFKHRPALHNFSRRQKRLPLEIHFGKFLPQNRSCCQLGDGKGSAVLRRLRWRWRPWWKQIVVWDGFWSNAEC